QRGTLRDDHRHVSARLRNPPRSPTRLTTELCRATQRHTGKSHRQVTRALTNGDRGGAAMTGGGAEPGEQLNHRERATLRAVARGGAEITLSAEPDLFIDGLACCDQITVR